MWKGGTKEVQQKAQYYCMNSPLEIVREIQPEKKWKMVWTCPRSCCWKEEIKILWDTMIYVIERLR